jgi:hydrogenase small subunit
MNTPSRRNLLKMGTRLAAAMGLSAAMGPELAEALEQLAAGRQPVLWLQGLSCTGCSISLLNSAEPGPAQVLTRFISMRFHANLSASSGAVSMDVINRTIAEGGYLLVVEGAVPATMPKACIIGGEPFGTQLARAAGNAKAIVALGTCAAFGGIPAAEHNPTGAVSVVEFLRKAGSQKPLIALPGCPTHPDWLVGTLVHVLKFGLPQLDAEGRPVMFYKRLVHDQCPRFADYEREKFAQSYTDDGCLFKLGCLGPITHADCTNRGWNSGVNSCIRAGAPCVGCASKEFAAKTAFPIYRSGETAPRPASSRI